MTQAEGYPEEWLVQTACVWEVTARKVGNVHRYADFADVTYLDFILSSVAFARALGHGKYRPVGEAVLMAVQSTREVTRTNTNLGIILLLAPMASVFFRDDLRRFTESVVRQLTVSDTRNVFEAIRLASPGGLGDAPEHDVREEPTLPLQEVMRLAADRDLIARQYANGFTDVFDLGVPAFLAAFERFGCVEAAVIDCQLRWLAAFPDSLIARKNGLHVAEDVRKWAAGVLSAGGLETAEGRAAGVALDRHLRSDGNRLNPGTTADLVTACLFVALRENKLLPSAPFRWEVEDWL